MDCILLYYNKLFSQVTMVTEHSSMATQWEQELTLQDCLRAFSQRCVNDIIVIVVS